MALPDFKRIATVCFFCSLLFSAPSQAQKNEDFNLNKNLEIFFSALQELRTLYVDSLNIDNLIKSSIDGMTSRLDPYTEFVPEEEVSDFDFRTTGRYGGIGALIQKDSSYVRISEPYYGFPAQKAGLVSGDRLLEIDGESLKNMDLTNVSNLLKGNPGTLVKLKVVKLKGGDTVNLQVKRQRIHVSGIVYSGIVDEENGIGYIRLTTFTENCSREFRDALTNLKKTGKLKSLIIDLRSNGGGVFEESIRLANLFVPKGVEIVSIRGREKNYNATYLTKEQPIDTQLPIAVLVNNHTASSSEIVSGAIQDLDRGVIVGNRTFGKGYIQAVRPTGYNTKLKITTAKYYIPSGRCIQAHNFSRFNEDGSVAFIPDSLKKEFRTKNGRKVYDGGGIVPDISVDAEEYSRIAVSLVTRNLIFLYSLKYYKEHDTIVLPENFKLSDADYEDFVEFLSDKSYDYQTLSENLFKQLSEAVKNEKYDSEAKEEIDALGEKLKHDKLKDLQIFKEEISQLLEEEIVNRYYFESGRVRSMLRNDLQFDKAVEVLKSPSEYNDILTNTERVSSK